MRLIRARVRNFKLLEDVELEFSTKRNQPLTVIRAENGSGKTSLLYAFQWAFHGASGLPAMARDLRLTSTATPFGQATTVSVTIEFQITDHLGNSARYRLIRSIVETPTAEDAFDRQPEQIRLLRITAKGEDPVASADATIRAWLPDELRDVFFTDGDSVQTFISGQIGARQRQSRVQDAIRDLLGIDRFRTAASDIEAAYRSLRAEAAKSGGRNTSNLESMLEEAVRQIDLAVADLAKLRERQANMAEQRARWDRELRGMRGIGELDEINSRIERAEKERDRLERERSAALVRMRDSLKSEDYSWEFMNVKLRSGVGVLADLADRRIIPGASVEVLADRLELGECICGASLEPRSEHREHVERLLEEQRGVSESLQRLTELSHLARRADAEEQRRRESSRAFPHTAAQLRQEFTEASDGLRAKALELEQLKLLRGSIDERLVRDLTSRIEGVDAKIAQAHQEIGAKEVELELARERQTVQEEALDAAQKEARVSKEVALKRDVAQDLTNLAADVLRVLEGDYVRRVSERMNSLFMEIVGTPDDPLRRDFGSELFARVHIDGAFNICIDTFDGRRLDPDFELNGASKRALTLSFIWSLMEVSGATAPRMIDTPLGMVSGGVKLRMLDAITTPPADTLPEFQVILFLTRAELRDAENLIDGRAGAIMTLSCSEHYPIDLVHSWGSDYPVSRICSCDHRQSCRMCARHYDGLHGVVFQNTAGILK